jgi:hypothetical protein
LTSVVCCFYLQQILWACGTRWHKLSHGVTNYAELLARLDKWRYQRNERVALVTFNYDTLLDEAVRWTLGLQLHSVESYIAAEEYKLIKPHGSVNWGALSSLLRWSLGSRRLVRPREA